MSSAEFSIPLDDASDGKYLVFGDDSKDKIRKAEKSKGTMSFWTVQRLGICFLFHTIVLIVYACILGVYFNRYAFYRPTVAVEQHQGSFDSILSPDANESSLISVPTTTPDEVSLI